MGQVGNVIFSKLRQYFRSAILMLRTTKISLARIIN